MFRKCNSCGIEAYKEEDLKKFKKAKWCKHGHMNLCIKCEYANRKSNMTESQLEKERLRKNKWTVDNKEYFKDWRKKKTYRAAHCANQAKRRALKAKAIPSWFDKKEVDYIYSLAKERGLEVDHIIPLNNPLVCGLHVQDNLRCIPKKLNQWKSNKLLGGCYGN